MYFIRNVRAKACQAGIGIFMLGALAAWDPVPAGDTTCHSAATCEFIALTAKQMRSDIGENYGRGVILRDARAAGQTLVVDVSLPLPGAAFKEPVGQRAIGVFGENFAGNFCEGAFSNDFYKLGRVSRGRGFSTDNELVTDQVIRSCGRRKA